MSPRGADLIVSTLAAAGGGLLVLIAGAFAFSDVKHDAKDAKDSANVNAAKIRSLEDTGAWLKAALKTGRDPDTGQTFPWAK